MADPSLTVIAVFFEMRREAARTLYTLSPEYQRGVGAGRLRGGRDRQRLLRSALGVGGDAVRPQLQAGPRAAGGDPSPAAAINRVAAEVSTPWVMCLIDGARMLTPGILAGALTASAGAPRAVRLHDRHAPGAGLAERAGRAADTAQREEDRLLDSVDWRRNGYALFTISTPAASVGERGFFSAVRESNCFALRRETFLDAGGFDERFRSPGGGLVNLDLFKRLVEDPRMTPICLLGEATFHQFHGGVATNVPMRRRIRGRPSPPSTRRFAGSRTRPRPGREPVYLGEIPEEARDLAQATDVRDSRRGRAATR